MAASAAPRRYPSQHGGPQRGQRVLYVLRTQGADVQAIGHVGWAAAQPGAGALPAQLHVEPVQIQRRMRLVDEHTERQRLLHGAGKADTGNAAVERPHGQGRKIFRPSISTSHMRGLAGPTTGATNLMVTR